MKPLLSLYSFSYYVMTESCHLMPENCGCFKCHTALWLADGISWHHHPMCSQEALWLAGRQDWVAGQASPTIVPGSTSEKAAPCHYIQGGHHFQQHPSPCISVLHCDWRADVSGHCHTPMLSGSLVIGCFLWTRKSSDIKK